MVNSGFGQWMMQRISAVILLAYFVLVGSYIILHPNLNYFQWKVFTDSFFVRWLTIFTILSMFAHGWIGMWTIATDYLKVVWVRWIFLLLVDIALVIYLIWGLQIVYS